MWDISKLDILWAFIKYFRIQIGLMILALSLIGIGLYRILGA